jgi:SAM-dependent methyltransferase
MKNDFLHSLHCPYSGAPLSLSSVVAEDGEEISYGIVSSEVADFPIVEGILRLHVDEYRAPIVERLRQGHRSEALTIALDERPFGGRAVGAIDFLYGFGVKWGFKRAARPLLRLKRSFVRTVSDRAATFAQIAETLTPGPMAYWQTYRFSMPTFLSTFALAHMVRDDSDVLSFACGTGQESFLISRMRPNSRIVCADYSFCSLYMVKKYFVPEAICVTLDADYLLPFESGQFSTIFSSDTLHMIDSKLNVAQEFSRVGNKTAVTLLPHLHNRLASPLPKSLSPRGYRELFRGVDMRIMPDEQVVRDYFFDDRLDLAREWSDEELVAAKQDVSVVVSKAPSIFVRRGNLWDERMRSIRHPRINPAYRIAGGPGKWELILRAKERYARTITGTDGVCIPQTCRVTARSLDTGGLLEFQRTDPRQFGRLARALAVLDLPERFIAESQVSPHGSDSVAARRQTV